MEDIVKTGEKVLMHTYSRFPLVFEKGEGVYLYDENGKKYLDFVAGIAVNDLGYNDEGLNKALEEQMHKLYHVSNLYYTKANVEAAKTLVDNSALDRVFFCNSGAEATEAALKLSRLYAYKFRNKETKIIAMNNSFHGRTFGSITATGQLKYQKGLGPILPDVVHVPFMDFEAIEKEARSGACGIIIEPVQGEGGIRPASKEFLQKVRALCDKLDILLIFDEVQCGIGRSGYLFAYEYFDVVPDVVCMAKGLGGGFPIGAILVKEEKAKGFEPGNHASTFGGNALASTASKYVLNKIINENILDNVKEQGIYLKSKLEQLKEKYDFINDVRGIGLMLGMEFEFPVSDIINKAIDKGLLLLNSGQNIIRFVPPLIISKDEIDEGITILDSILQEI
ncbi:aspartate aminotransferase family protein [Anaerofustis sp. NSJ-163]|uniref:aspartate aminotransferase family protein n=1 Tax=Anaerofustis sp. NSJ-163 TaxID=2944391 RepID=UPI00209C566D|nr:aspartate aminotransferase family protein [Anaerofustis sp. NSJ-163]MCO8194366.1 aspartate aminotransferase family protein [Anaerofustis sp. NSJ-163]